MASKLDQIERILGLLIRLAESDPKPAAVPCNVGSIYSPDEKAIIEAVRGCPLPMKVLIEKVGIEKSKLATLAANLKARGVLSTCEDGYQLASEAAGAEEV